MTLDDARAATPSTELPLSLRLKEGTRAAHDSVENAAAFNRLIVVRIPAVGEGGMDAARHAQAVREYREIYRRFLIGAHGFEAAVNARIAGSPAFPIAAVLGYAAETKEPTELIRDDLRAVFGPQSEALAGTMNGLPAADTLAEIAGLEYVRRGSRAGGAVIAAVVQQNLGFTREHGASFLAQYGKKTKSVLVAMKEWLDSLPISEQEMVEAVAMASATFAAVERYHLALEESFARG